MTANTMHLTLKAHEKIFLNGAVIRFDRKTKIELLNDACFLLEGHVLQAEETDTPLKQLYYAAQIRLIDPANAQEASSLFLEMLTRLITTTSNATILAALRECFALSEQERIFDILKIIRGLFTLEAEILDTSSKTASSAKSLAVKAAQIRQKFKPTVQMKVTSQPAHQQGVYA